MRILLSCLQDFRPHPIPAYRFWAEYFRHGIREAGHEAVEVPGIDWAAGITRLTSEERAAWKSETWDRVLGFLADERKADRSVDLFLSYLYPEQVEPAALAEIRRLGIPSVNFFCDNVREFRRVPVEYRHFDLHWVPEYEALPMYRQAELEHIHAPMPAWIAPEDRCEASEKDPSAVFIGSEDRLRRNLLGEVIRLGEALTIYGRGWAGEETAADSGRDGGVGKGLLRNQIEFLRARGGSEWLRKTWRRLWPGQTVEIPAGCLSPTISAREYVQFTKESQVVIGINRVPTFSRSLQNPLTYSRLRDIEAPMMGACYLTEWTEGLSQLYELGSEIETYRTAEELAAKITELRGNPEKRARLRRRGQLRALTDHTIGKSIAKILRALG